MNSVHTCVKCGNKRRIIGSTNKYNVNNVNKDKCKCKCGARENYEEYKGNVLCRTKTWKGNTCKTWKKSGEYYYVGGTKNGVKKNIKPHWCDDLCPCSKSKTY